MVAVGHFVVGLLATWYGDSILFSDYNQSVLREFGFSGSQSIELQLWWLAMFGATLQAFSILLWALIYAGDKYKDNRLWLLIVIAVLIWAPQDIYFSLLKNIWLNVWVDLAAVVTLFPSLVFLIKCDQKK